MKKVLFVNNSLDHGGAERALVNVINMLSCDDYQVDLFTLYSSGIYDDVISKKVKYRYIFKKRGALFNKVLLKVLCKILPRRWLYKRVIKGEYDYEIAFLQGFPTEFVRCSKNPNTQKIAFVHSDFLNNYDVGGVYKTREQCHKAYKGFDKVCFVSKTAQQGFEKAIGLLSNGFLVHNVMNTEGIHLQSKEKIGNIYSSNAIRIISVGRLIKIKAIERVINAVEYSYKKGINIECIIIGDGPERENLQQLIEEKKLGKNIKILGYCDNPYKYMKQADIYVCSSLTEGYSTTAVESLILGVPILTTEVSGMLEIIAESNAGIIVENSEDALKENLYLLAANPEKIEQMKVRAKQRGLEFDAKKQMQEFIDMLEA